MATKSKNRIQRAAQTTGGYFDQPSRIGQNQIDEGSAPITESAPAQTSGSSRMVSSGPITSDAPIAGQAGQLQAPSEAPSFEGFAQDTRKVANYAGAGALAGVALKDKNLMGTFGPAAGLMSTVSNYAGLAGAAQKGNYVDAGVSLIGMANPVAGMAAGAARDWYGGYNGSGVNAGNSFAGDAALGFTTGQAPNTWGGSAGGYAAAMAGRTAEQYRDDGGLNIYTPGGGRYTEAPRDTSNVNLATEMSRASDSVFGGSTATPSYTPSAPAAEAPTYTARSEGYQHFADGGPVGMTGAVYADGGSVSSAPTSLAQMGFADGGGIGMSAPGGTAAPDPLAMIGRMVRDPAVQQRVQQLVAPAMQSGQLTPDELVTLGRIAEAAIHNPQLYPQLRKFAAENGLTPLPPSYDPRVATMLVVASKVMGGGQQATPPGQVPPMDQAQMQNPNGQANGGMLQGPGTGRSDSIGTVNESTGTPVKVANGEYVVPKHVVDAKGKEFFDKMLRQYAQLTPQGA